MATATATATSGHLFADGTATMVVTYWVSCELDASESKPGLGLHGRIG